jgi:predicted nuclease of predicted toxin-antitoxin system
MASFYANENFPLPAVEELRRLGHDVLTIQETGRAERSTPDEEVLAFSKDENRILLTLNRMHFIRLHREQPNHAGIVVCSFDSDFVALAERVHSAIEAQAVMSNQLVRINRPSSSQARS